MKFEIRRSVEFSSAAARCIPWGCDGHSNGETCRNKGGSEVARIRDSTKQGVPGREQFNTLGLRIETQSLNNRLFRSMLY